MATFALDPKDRALCTEIRRLTLKHPGMVGHHAASVAKRAIDGKEITPKQLLALQIEGHKLGLKATPPAAPAPGGPS